MARTGGSDWVRTRAERQAVDAVRGLQPYLQTPIQGLWRDTLRTDGTFVEEPAPASSFYHIVCACADLFAATGV